MTARWPLSLLVTLCMAACQSTTGVQTPPAGKSPSPAVSGGGSPAPIASTTPASAPAPSPTVLPVQAWLSVPYAVGRTYVYDTESQLVPSDVSITILEAGGGRTIIRTSRKYRDRTDDSTATLADPKPGELSPIVAQVLNNSGSHLATTASNQDSSSESVTVKAGTFTARRLDFKQGEKSNELAVTTWLTDQGVLLKQVITQNVATTGWVFSAELAAVR